VKSFSSGILNVLEGWGSVRANVPFLATELGIKINNNKFTHPKINQIFYEVNAN
jgi:hypothetical protein